MNRIVMVMAGSWLFMLPVLAQGNDVGNSRRAGVDIGSVSASERLPRPKPTQAARQALAAARALAATVKAAKGAARAGAMEAAAKAYDDLAQDFASESLVAAQAAFRAAELWRRHGSLVLAEQDYRAAARQDTERYGQRATLGAADMQRRLGRAKDALRTYAQVIPHGPGTSRAQVARLWRGRLQQELGQLDKAIATFRAALESAERPHQVMDAVNWLAKALVRKGDLDGAARAIDHADQVVREAVADDPTQEALLEVLRELSARRALQRARDKQTNAVEDARALERSRAGALS